MNSLYTNKMDKLEEIDKILQIYSLPRMNLEEIKIVNRPITSNEIGSVIKNSQETKAHDQIASQEMVLNILRISIYPSQTTPKSWRGKNISKLILWGQHHRDTETRQRHHRKLHTNITDEHTCISPQQKASKLNSATH